MSLRAATLALIAAAGPRQGAAAGPQIAPEAQRAIAHGPQSPAARQQPDESFGSTLPVATAALCALAILSSGDAPGRGARGAHLQRAAPRTGWQMYGVDFSTALALLIPQTPRRLPPLPETMTID
jgi:hypothetical protein